MIYAIHARGIIRSSHKDPGKLAVWLVDAKTPAQAQTLWAARDTHRDFTFESIQPHAKRVVRIL